MTDYIEINRGECLRVQLAWQDEDGTPIDLTNAVLEITESSVPVAPEFTVLDALAGEAELHIADTDAFRLGRVDWIRIGMTPDGGTCPDTTPPIWIRIV